jgi:hypothetical protein
MRELLNAKTGEQEGIRSPQSKPAKCWGLRGTNTLRRSGIDRAPRANSAATTVVRNTVTLIAQTMPRARADEEAGLA